MRVFAPGKLVLTGAYAVLEGATAIAVAVNRGAVADDARRAEDATLEVRAALGDAPAPEVDATPMFAGDRKLGLGASAAILVASLGVIDAARGADLGERVTRDALFERARAAHAVAQSGGSGVDIAASLYGGTIAYKVGSPVRHVQLPDGVVVEVFACATSARTSELRAHVERLARTAPEAYRSIMTELSGAADDALRAVETGDARAFVDAVRRTARGLARLGEAADVGIVPPGFDELEELAARDDAAFCVSGAGGGDVAIHVGRRPASRPLLARASELGLARLPLSFDTEGARVMPEPHADRNSPR